MGSAIRYPERHADFLERCHPAGQRPRMQSRPEVVPLRQGDAVIFAVHHRPVAGLATAARRTSAGR